jgi:hyperosmotically inducible protein
MMITTVLLLVSALLIGVQGCQSTTGKTAKQTMNDASISTAVQAKLTGDRLSNFARVDVDTERGVVSLNGVVPSAEQRARAEELTRQVSGVVRVNNNLQIQNQPATTGKLAE